MEGYRLRSPSVPSDTRAPDAVPPPQSVVSHPITEGPVDESVPVDQCLVSAGRPGATQEGHQASSGRSGAALRALLTDLPLEILDVHATEDLGEILDPEADAYANVGTSTSFPDLAVVAAANVGRLLVPQSWMWLSPQMSGQQLAYP